jgi:hypothetical protein
MIFDGCVTPRSLQLLRDDLEDIPEGLVGGDLGDHRDCS